MKPTLEQLDAAPAGARLINPSPLTPTATKRNDGRWYVAGEPTEKSFTAYDLGTFDTDKLIWPALIRVIAKADAWSWTCPVDGCDQRFVVPVGRGLSTTTLANLIHDTARQHITAHPLTERAAA